MQADDRIDGEVVWHKVANALKLFLLLLLLLSFLWLLARLGIYGRRGSRASFNRLLLNDDGLGEGFVVLDCRALLGGGWRLRWSFWLLVDRLLLLVAAR